VDAAAHQGLAIDGLLDPATLVMVEANTNVY
jgi:hypothetical protein